MAERYNPVVRERQREHIRALMQQDRDALFQQMDKRLDTYISPSELLFDFVDRILQDSKQNPYPNLELGMYSWRFYVYMRRLQPMLCKEWRFCQKVRDPRNSDRVELATQLADFLVDKGMRRAGVDTAAVALLMIDPAELCGCEE